MNIKKGKIKNINKKLIAGALVFTLVTVSLTGCVSSIDDINYSEDESGYINGIDGTVSYDFFRSCYFCKVENNITNESYYTIGFAVSNYRWSEGYDIFTKQNFRKGDFELEIYDGVVKWLENLNKVKEEYTEEELREFLNIFIEKQKQKQK